MKKQTFIAIFSLLLLCVMATPLVSSVAAKKAVIPYDYTVVGPPAAETIVDEKFMADGQIRIAKGTYRTFPYNGPLGVGFVYTEAIISITHAEDPETYPYTKFYGNGNYRAILTITSGPFGTGTLEGQMILYWDGDLSMPFGPETHYNYWGDTIYSRGTGELEGIMIKQTMYSTMLSPTLMSTQFTGEVILP